MDGAGDGNRTHVASLEGWNSTIELHPHASMESWSGRRDSDSRPPPWQGGALPTELLPQIVGCGLVRAKGLEPIRRWAPEPKSGASANSATPARAGMRARTTQTRQPTQTIIARTAAFVNTIIQILPYTRLMRVRLSSTNSSTYSGVTNREACSFGQGLR